MKAKWSVTTEKGLCHFLTALKAFKTRKELHHCLTTLKDFNTEKRAPSLSYDFTFYYYYYLLYFNLALQSLWIVIEQSKLNSLIYAKMKKDSITFLQLLKFLILIKIFNTEKRTPSLSYDF